MAVQKREKIPDALEPKPLPGPDIPTPESIIFPIKGKEYPLPHLQVKQYRKILKVLNAREKDWENMTEEENLDATRDFFYELLKDEIPDLKKSDLDELPVWMYGGEFLLRLKVALFRVPLHS